MHSVVVHYQEIALKGRNRPWFIDRLVRNLRAVLEELDVREVRSIMGRIEIVLGPLASWEQVRSRLETVCGIANFSIAGRTTTSIGAISQAILAELGDRQVESFAIAARRADKRYSLTSPEIEQAVGTAVKEARGWKVDLRHPALTIHIEVLQDHAFYFFGKERGAGGMPTGVSGRVACLISGGIDSPVAAWRMMRRGCRVQFVHFHSYPIVSDTSQRKVRRLVQLLTRYQQRSRLYLVAFGDIQRRVVLEVPSALRVVVYRRLMLRIAERLASREGARALVTGEVIGQVASQTVENLSVIGAAATMPVFRPLIGMDKEEITAEAQRIGTFTASIVPDDDCCTLFTPRHPVTRATREEIEFAERTLPMNDLVEEAVRASLVEDFKFPMLQSATHPSAGVDLGAV
jgi:tRNA uracil 4-sulfurtransferase